MCLLTFPVKANSDLVQAVSSQKPFVTPSLVTPTHLEEDILFQWRLRRKIEQARECPQPLQHPSLHGPTFSWQAPSLSHPSASGQAYKVGLVVYVIYYSIVYNIFQICGIIKIPSFLYHLQQQQSAQPPEFSQKATHPHIAAPQSETTEAHASCPPASGPPPFPAFVVSGSSAIAHVPAHMHLLCDVLPCPLQSSHGSRQQNISQNISESHSKVSHKKTQVPGNSMNTFPDEPIREHIPSPVPASAAAIEGASPSPHKRPERNKNKKVRTKESERTTVMSIRKQEKSRSSI